MNFTLWRTDRTDANLVRRIALGADPQEIVDVFGAASTSPGPWARPPREARLPALRWRSPATGGAWPAARWGYPFTLGAFGYLVLEETEARDIVTLWRPRRWVI